MQGEWQETFTLKEVIFTLGESLEKLVATMDGFYLSDHEAYETKRQAYLEIHPAIVDLMLAFHDKAKEKRG